LLRSQVFRAEAQACAGAALAQDRSRDRGCTGCIDHASWPVRPVLLLQVLPDQHRERQT